MGILLQNVDRAIPVVVCGAGGFIGGHLVKDLLQQGYTSVRAVDVKPIEDWWQVSDEAENLRMDLSQRSFAYEALQGQKHVYNLAADMGGMGFIENNKALCMLSVLINTHLLLAARDNEVERYFYASSACVYNASKQNTTDVVPLKEEDAYPAMPEDGYGWEKLFSERMCQHFHEDFGLETRIARYHNVYGPFGSWRGGREKAPAALCRKVARVHLDLTDKVEIWGDGEQMRSFMFIDDCVYGTQRLMLSDYRQPLNIGSAEVVSINELVSVIERIAGVSVERVYDTSKPQGVVGRSSDNNRIQEVLGWEPYTSLEEGLRATYKWIAARVEATSSAAAI